MNIAFVGMTHLGLVSGSAAAGKGLQTLCVDSDAARIAQLLRGELPVKEPGLAALIQQNGARQSFSDDFEKLAAADLVVIAPDTPTDDFGRADVSGLGALIAKTAPHLDDDAVLVILSQSPPGFMRQVDFPSDRLFHQVETLVFGAAVERALTPERIIIGAANPSREPPESYRRFLECFDCPVLPMSFESAELAKISINLCLLSSISVANTMAEICEAVGADWSEIAPALRLDRRIGAHAYLKPGLGVAGGNLERDMAATIALAERHDADAGVVRAWIRNSERRRNWAAQRLAAALPRLPENPRIAVWGLTYKENTDATKNSPALATLEQFPTRRFRAHDPAAPHDVGRRLGRRLKSSGRFSEQPPPKLKEIGRRNESGFLSGALDLERVDDALEAVADADLLMVLTPWPEYREIGAERVAAAMSGRVVIDPYAVFAPEAAASVGFEHHCLGRAPSGKGSQC